MKNIFKTKGLFTVVVITGLLTFTSACSKQSSENQIKTTTNASAQNSEQSSSDFESAFKAANKLRLEAAALNYEWRETESFLLEAKTAFASGDNDAAMQLVNKAHQQAELAIAQAKAENTAWKSSVPN